MAVVKYGPIISEARGSVGGVVFSRGRAGTFARSRVKPVYNPTNRRTLWTSGMPVCYTMWLSELTDEDREDWNTLAAASEFTNALGDVHHLSGWALFLRLNSILRFISPLMMIPGAPPNAFAAHVPFTLANDGAGNLTVDFDGALVAGDHVYFWASPALPHTKFFYRGPYVNSIALADVQVDPEPFALPGFDYADGDRVFIRVRRTCPDKGLSAPFYQMYDVVIP